MNQIFKSEKRSVLVERVANQIRDAIKDGRLRPGERIIETDLARDMDIGRNAIREAIRYLEREGLITSEPYKGARVAELTRKDLQDLFDLRLVLEQLALKTLIKDFTKEKKRKLDQKIEEMKSVALTESIADAVTIDLSFHQLICELSGNQKLLRVWNDLSNQLRAFIAYRNDTLYMNDTPEDIMEAHYPVYEAILSGDEDEAVVHMKLLMVRGYNMAMEHFEDSLDTDCQQKLLSHG